MPAGRWPQGRIPGMVPPIPLPVRIDGTAKTGRSHRAPAGLMFLAITSIGWGFNWPITKYLLSELPPLTLRGATGVVGAGPARRARDPAQAKPACAARTLAQARARRVSQRRLLDGADGTGAALASRERSGADRLYHAGMGLDDRVADTWRTAQSAARDILGHGLRGPERDHGRQRPGR